MGVPPMIAWRFAPSMGGTPVPLRTVNSELRPNSPPTRSRIAFLPHLANLRASAVQPVNPASPSKSIILVDDEKSYNDLIRQMLVENLDCPVHGFTRPLEALDALRSLDPGVVVTDYFMPEMNGIEFIQRAAPLVPNAVFVMISGNNLSGEQHRMEKLSALKGFLAKPFGWRKLADEIIRVWPPETRAPANRAAPPSS